MDPRLWQPNMALNRMVSIVWKDIMQIKSKNPEVFSKYSENISISIGNGLSTQFWIDPWVYDACLCRLYPRIFNVISNKDESVAEVFQRKEELFFWSFQQRRNLFVWEDEEMQDLRNFLDGLHISIQMRPDHIIWMACNLSPTRCLLCTTFLLSLHPLPKSMIASHPIGFGNLLPPIEFNALFGWSILGS